jgi:chitodextrinase
VVLSANAGASDYLAKWVGCDSTTGGECTITLNSQRFAEPIFASSTPVELQPSVVVLSKATVDAIQAHSPGLYVFAPGTTAAQNLVPGNVIVGLGTTSGVLARVTAVSTAQNGAISVSTMPARLTDVYAQGTLWYSEPLTQGQVKRIKILAPGVRVKQSSSASSDQFTADLAATVVGASGESGNTASLSGTLTLSFQPVFAITFSLLPLGVQQFQATLITTSSQTLDAAVNIPACTNALGQLLNGEQPIYELVFDPIPVGVGIWITPIVTVYVGVDGQADCSIQTSVSASESLTGGIEYTSGSGWQPVSSLSTDFTYQTPEFQSQVNLKAYAAPQFTADIDDIAGPFFNLEGYARAYAYGEAGSTTAAGWDLYAGVDANVGLEADVLGYDLGQYQVQIYNYEKTLASGQITANPSSSVPSAPQGLTATAVSNSEIELTWGSSTDTVGIAHYDLYSNGTLLGKFSNTSTQDTGLSADTKYCYDVVAVDVNGNESGPSTTTCATTLPTTDNSAPTVPAGLTATPTSGSAIVLSWQAATDNVAVAGYTIYRNGIPVGTSANTDFTDAPLTPATQYCYTVSAFDEAGNSSAESSKVCVTTPNTVAASSYTSSTEASQSLTMSSGFSQYFYIGSTAGGSAACGCTGGYGQNPMSAISWNQDLGVIASASGNLSISIGRSSSNQGSYQAAAGNKGVAGFATNGYVVSQIYTEQASPGTQLAVSFATGSDDLVLVAVGGQGTGEIALSGIPATQVVDSTYSEGGSDVIASQAFYTATLPAGSYTVDLSSTTYATNASAAIGAVVYVLTPID